MNRKQQTRIIPGFSLTMGVTITYLGLMVMIPLFVLLLKTFSMGWADFWEVVSSQRAVAAYRLSFGTAAVSALINAVFGLMAAWVLVRYDFPGKKLLDAVVDLPFALPTAVAGIALTSLYSSSGWVGGLLHKIGIKAAFTPLGIIIALTFIGLPFVIRTVQPVLQDFETELEETAYSLGATYWQTFFRVIFPVLFPAVLTGTAMAFARALGEYGSVVFIAGNVPMKTEIAPLLIMTRLEQFDYAGAMAIAVVMLVSAFIFLFLINLLQSWSQRYQEK